MVVAIQHSLLKQPKKKKGKFTFIDLFAGIGGTRIAFERAGGECVFSSEWDKYCQKTYEANFGEIPAGDITKIEASEIPDFDILVGGFPCQAFSMAGKRGGFNDTRGTLFFDVARIIKAKRPKAFLLENVQGLVTHDGGKTLQVILDTLKGLDYNVFYKVLNAADFGVPQRRKRIYIVGFDKNRTPKDLKFEHPKGTRKNVYINKFIEENVEGYGVSEYLQKVYMFKKDDGLPEIVDKNSKKHVKTLTSTYHKIQRLTGTFVRDGKTGLRLLTANECKAMMGFDKDFKIPVSRTQMYRQLGNSVAIPAVEAVARELVKTLEDTKIV
jgi:DNA (cytosine-5)-methyltransferase 1